MLEFSEDKINVSIVTPEEKVYEGAVDFISVPSSSGSLGILPKCLPIVSRLNVGIVKLVKGKDATYIGVCRGYIEHIHNKANIITERAIVTTKERSKETVEELNSKHNIIQEITEDTKRVIKTIATIKGLK